MVAAYSWPRQVRAENPEVALQEMMGKEKERREVHLPDIRIAATWVKQLEE